MTSDATSVSGGLGRRRWLVLGVVGSLLLLGGRLADLLGRRVTFLIALAVLLTGYIAWRVLRKL